MARAWADSAVSSPTASPLSPRFDFIDGSDDVLQWQSEWERRSASMDEKHIEVLSSHWQLMRESAKEHSQIIHQMKRAMYELRANGLTLQDRLDAMEKRIRDEVSKEYSKKLEDVERRLRDKITQEQQSREADVAVLKDLIRMDSQKLSERLDTLSERVDREKQARERGLDAVQSLLEKEAGAMTDIKRLLAEEASSHERCFNTLKDRVDRLERLLADSTEKQVQLQAAVAADLRSEREQRERADDSLAAKVARLQDRSSEIDALKEQMIAEKQHRDGQLRALRDVLSKDLGDVRDALRADAAGREHLASGIRATVEDRLGAFEASIQTRVEQLLRILQEGTGSMLHSWRSERPIR